MSKFYNPITRLQIYWNFFSSGVLISMNDISEQSYIPIKIIREDFLFFFSNKSFDYNLFIFEDTTEEIYETLENNINVFLKKFSSGDYDDIPLCLDLPQLKKELVFINLSKDEILAFNKLFDTNISEQNIVTIKEDYNDNHVYTNLHNLLSIVNNAILNKNTITITYKTKKHSLRDYTLFPLKIIHDKSTNLFTLLSLNEKQQVMVNRFDCIKDISISNIPYNVSSTDVLDILPNVWSNNFTDPPYKVKVKFINEASVFKKVKKELACRVNGSLYEKDDCLYYEDIVYGIEGFKNYIFSYGSSAIVLEPKHLQDDIIKSLKERENFYKV